MTCHPRVVALLLGLGAVGSVAACSSSEPLTSSFGASGTTCANPVRELPAPAPPVAARAFVFHVTNRANEPRWVQTAGDEGCAPFDILRGGAALVTAPPPSCGCNCKPPAPRTAYRRLGPGESLDLPWDGVAHQLAEVCVTGQAFGCDDGEVVKMWTSRPYAATALRYTLALHVEKAPPPGCQEQAEGSWLCTAEGVAEGGGCAHGTGKASAELLIDTDAGPVTLEIPLE